MSFNKIGSSYNSMKRAANHNDLVLERLRQMSKSVDSKGKVSSGSRATPIASEERSIVDNSLQAHYSNKNDRLELYKGYKEVIASAVSLQKEIRIEEMKFFAELKEVQMSLNKAQVAPKLQEQWISDLKNSYISSLRLSNKLMEEYIISLLTDIQEEFDPGEIIEINEQLWDSQR